MPQESTQQNSQTTTYAKHGSGPSGPNGQSGAIHTGASGGYSGKAFRLEELTSRTSKGALKLWKIVLDLPGEKVNKLGRAVLEEAHPMIEALKELHASGRIDALLLTSGKPGTFIAGADINMFTELKTAEDAEALSLSGHAVANAWEDLPFPTVAAIEGAALGGGCEFALASTAMVASNSSAVKIGLPEVMLGIVPGMGGCVRLPRKIGLAGSLDMILTGKTLNGERAYKMGLTEALLPKEDFEGNVIHWVEKNIDKLKAGKRIAREPKLGGVGGLVGSAMEKNPAGRSFIRKKAREGVMAKTRGHYPAPLAAIDVLADTGAKYGPKLKRTARERASKIEARAFGRLAVTDVSKNLVRIFFMTEEVKKSNGLPGGRKMEIPKVRNAAVLGAGVMGGGIAQLFAAKDVEARMKDLNVDALNLGVKSAAKLFQKQVKRRKISKREYLQKLSRISPTLTFDGFASAEVVVEAVIEKMEIKKSVFKDLENHVSDDCVIASNTSSLSISEMQNVMKHPERFAGMHFFNPVHRMPLVEVIRGQKSDDRAVATIFELSKQLGKTPVVVKDAPGFLVNRLLMPYLNEATWLLADGAAIPEVDRILLDFGMPMGPMELIDEVGIDVGEKVAHILFEAFGERMTPSPFHHRVVESGYLGKKNAKGLYNYEEGGKRRFDSKIYNVLQVQPKSGSLSKQEILERCVLPMINEGSRCLEEGIVSSPSELDLAMIMGTGFPPFRGGLMRYADSVGVKVIVERLREHEKKLGKRFEPAPALLARAEKNQPFYG